MGVQIIGKCKKLKQKLNNAKEKELVSHQSCMEISSMGFRSVRIVSTKIPPILE